MMEVLIKTGNLDTQRHRVCTEGGSCEDKQVGGCLLAKEAGL